VRTRIAVAAALAVLALVLPASAWAEEAKSPSKEATGTYDLDFTLPTEGKSGCQVCHGDPNLVRSSGEATVSIYVSTELIASSAHAEEVCTGCHIDFAYKTPHDNVINGGDWQSTAKQACSNCKQHQPQFTEYASGAHTPAGKPGVTAEQLAAEREAAGKPPAVPLCGDCHGGHDIASKEDTSAVAAYHKSGLEVCGGCHEDYATTYADYYHGAAYKEGALDAPACWDCHGTHEILPADNRRSMVSEQRLVETCGQEGCHVGEVTEEFVEYAQLVHGKDEMLQENPLWAAYDSARDGFQQAVSTVKSWFN